MFDLNKNSIISFNPQYYAISQSKKGEKNNIYLGGDKIMKKEQKSIKKGIILSKSLSCERMCSNLDYKQKTIKKSQQRINFTTIPTSSSMKPKITSIKNNYFQSQSKFYNSNFNKRSLSSPLVLYCVSNGIKNSKENHGFQNNITNNLYLRNNITTSLSYQHFIKSQPLLPKLHSFKSKPIISKQNCKIQQENYNVSPAQKILQQQNLNQAQSHVRFLNSKSPSCKILKNHSPIQTSFHNNQEVTKIQFPHSITSTKTIRPMTFKSPIKSKVNFNIQTQQKNIPIFSSVKKQVPSAHFIEESKLKQSFSTAQERSNQENHNFSEKDYETTDNPEDNKQQLLWPKNEKYSVKSLWDSVENCTISLICQNNEQQSPKDKHSAFNKNAQRTYNELSQYNSLEELVIEHNTIDNKKSTFSTSQFSPIRNL